MKSNRKIHIWPFKFAIFASVQFILLTVISMLFYPGGTFTDIHANHYQFFTTYFSNLGMTETLSGQKNTISAVLFIIALAVTGTGMIFFFLAEQQLFHQKKITILLSRIGSAIGVISGISYAGVAFTPYNLMPYPHLFFVLTAFWSFFAVVLMYMIVISLSSEYKKRYAVLYLVFALMLACFLLLLFYGPRFDSPEGVFIQATSQKIIVYAAIICILLQSFGALKFTRNKQNKQF